MGVVSVCNMKYSPQLGDSSKEKRLARILAMPEQVETQCLLTSTCKNKYLICLFLRTQTSLSARLQF